VSGRLVVCPTPIGNLEDVTLRVLRVLREADVIACEDTRVTGKLLAKHELGGARLVSYHEHNERKRATEIVKLVRDGKLVALVSDAGMPGVSDPGHEAIVACLDAELDLEVLPGPSAVVVALVASGLPSDRWRFAGFLPRKKGELRDQLEDAAQTLVAYESPRRLGATLALLAEIDPKRSVAVCRELTKLHEEVVRGPASQLAERFAEGVRGEIVLVVGPTEALKGDRDLQGGRDAVDRLVEAGAKRRAAAAVVSSLTGVPANRLYGD